MNTYEAEDSPGMKIRRAIKEAFAKEPDDAGIFQGVRYIRGGVPNKRIVLYPSAKNRGTIPCEGRPEGDYAESLEIDPQVKAYRGQPIVMKGPRGGRMVPDFALQYADGTYALVDVKPAGLLLDSKVAQRMLWIRTILSDARTPHRIVTVESLQKEPHRSIRKALRKGTRVDAHVGIQKAARSFLSGGTKTVDVLRRELVALGYPAYAVEKLALMGLLSFDTTRIWSSSTLIGDIHDPANRYASRDTVHAVLA